MKIHITITMIDNVSSTNARMVSRAHVKWLQRCSTAHRACMAGARSQSMSKRPPTLVSSARRRDSTWLASSIMLKVLCPMLFALSHRLSKRQPRGCWTTPSTSTTPSAHCMERNGRRILVGRPAHRARTRRAPQACLTHDKYGLRIVFSACVFSAFCVLKSSKNHCVIEHNYAVGRERGCVLRTAYCVLRSRP